jgi:hypothetical protein
MMNRVKRFSYLCKQIVLADNSIRFVGITNKFGKKVVSEYRNGLVPLMTEAESELSAIEAVIRMNTRREENFQSKIGKPKYSFTDYNKIKRATLLLDNEDYPILMISLNKEADHEHVILDKVLPIIRKEGLSSSS